MVKRNGSRLSVLAAQVPKCGSFSVTVEKAILPALAAVVQAREDGETHADALSRAMPILLAAFGLAMPCREMCEAVVTSCNCNNDYTFGKLLKAWLDSAKSSSGSAQPLSTDSAASILSNFYDKPLCSMFASRAKAGFSGHCYDLPTACSNPDQWCNGDGGANKDIMVVQELMAAQLATALFGVAGGLFDDEQEMLDTSGNENVTSYIVDAGGLHACCTISSWHCTVYHWNMTFSFYGGQSSFFCAFIRDWWEGGEGIKWGDHCAARHCMHSAGCCVSLGVYSAQEAEAAQILQWRRRLCVSWGIGVRRRRI